MKDLNVKNIQPTKGYVLVEPSKAEAKTASGIILPESDSEKPQHGVVLAVGEAACGDCCGADSCCDDHSGEGCCEEKAEDACCGGGCGDCGCDDESCDDKDACCETPVKVGDKVIYKKWGGNDFKIGDTEYQFLKFEDILAVIK